MTIVNTKHDFAPWDFSYRKQSAQHSIFYLVFLQTMTGIRYFKIGTTEKGLGTRFGGADYKKYSVVRLMCVIELDHINGCYQFEDCARSFLRFEKGFTWVKNDRFKYFTLPEVVPLFDKPNHQCGECVLVKATKNAPAHYEVKVF